MHVDADSFSLPKNGNTEDEYEDASALWPLELLGSEICIARFAAADGATESSYCKLWANLLVEAYRDGELEGRRRTATLRRLRAEWLAIVNSRPLPWYAEHNLTRGAFSALVGLRLDDSPGKRRWRAFGVGDSCIVHVRGESVLTSFPLDTADAFSNSPYLLSSIPGGKIDWKGKQGQWESGDSFYLMTDSLAMWFLSESEKGEKPWQLLGEFRPDDCSFAKFISGLWTSGSLRNDDVTLVRVTVN